MIADKIYNCAMYLRLSKEDLKKNDESSSIQSQRLIINGFAKHNNLKIIDEYVDDGYSGGNFDRPGFLRMIKDIENGRINCVITKDLSRLGREMYGTGKYIEEYFLEHNIRYIAINDSFDSNIGDSMLGIRLGVNDLYLRDVSKKVRSSFRAKQERGEYIGSFACYGYSKDPNDHHKLVIDPDSAKIVKYIFSLCLEGYGASKIGKKLTEEKIPIPVVYKKETRGLKVIENDGYGVWKTGTIKNILKNEMYIGNMVQHTLEKISYNQKKLRKVDEENRIIVKNTHEPIIDKETFEKVQKVLKDRTYMPNQKNLERFLLSGLMKCGRCGHTIGVSLKKRKSGDSLYTYCNHYQRKGKYSNCSPNRLNYKKLENDVLMYLNKIGKKFIETYDFKSLTDNTIYEYNKDIEKMNIELDVINKKIDKEMNIISNLYTDKVEGVISLDVYKNLSKSHEDELSKLRNIQNSLKESIESRNNKNAVKEFYNCRKAVEDFLSLSNPSRKTIKALINKILLYDNEDGKKVKILFNFKSLTDIAQL